MMVGAGAGSESKAMDIGNLLKPALQKGALRVIGSTTYAEFRKHFEKDAALLRRFQRLDVGEPTIDEAIEIIKGLKGYYEEFHGITYTDDAVEQAVKLSVKHIHKNHLPDKAIDIIDAAGAKNKVVNDESKVTELTISEIMDEVADIANIPVSKLKTSDNEELEQLEPALKSVIYGQDGAIETLVSSILIARAGMRDPDKPEACYLFNGPTGVGKTELAKQLAIQLGMHFTRIDMSEFMEKHAVSKLIGSPPGYVGYDENGGLLITTVDEHPSVVILLDEIEKAHPDVFNILLQVMDNGKLTNGNGKTVNFRDVILILTGNIGSAQAAKPKIGFGDNSNIGLQEEEVKRVFAPEFINRLDGVVTFNSLNREVSDLILNKFINNLNLQLSEKGVTLTLTEAAKEELLKIGFDASMGARPLSRIIHSRIKKPLAPKILFGELKNGGGVIVDYVNDFTFTTQIAKEEVLNGDR
jgi:ATP-dependent Clp protease ATP-binding subunit ClpA